jgi:hypothetical protein
MGTAREEPTIIECRNGPLLVMGVSDVVEDDGTVRPLSRPISAICRCGRSATRPWCDGTHKTLPTPWEPAPQAHVSGVRRSTFPR